VWARLVYAGLKLLVYEASCECTGPEATARLLYVFITA
jgi:hypothetical protein